MATPNEIRNIDFATFSGVMYRFRTFNTPYKDHIEDCCTQDVIDNLFEITQVIKNKNKGAITYKDICIAVFGLYYKMNLVDISWDVDILKELITPEFADNIVGVNDLILRMGVGDMIDPATGVNLSKDIRRYMLFGNSKEPNLNSGRRKGRKRKARKARTRKARSNTARRQKSRSTRTQI